MRQTTTETGLIAVEFDGSPRSGKGTSAKHLERVFPRTRTAETGKLYRAITFLALRTGLIEPGMTESDVATNLSSLTAEQTEDMAFDMERVVNVHGESVLYDRDVAGLVGKVSPLVAVREGVKSRFRDDLTRMVADDGISMVILDGRNLAAVARQVEGLEIIQRTFFVCSDNEAANRELARHLAELEDKGLPTLDEDAKEEYIVAKVHELVERRHQDESRGNDPVKPEPDAIRYWDHPGILEHTINAYILEGNMTYRQARDEVSGENHYRYGRIGAGAIAYSQGQADKGEARQVLFDTNACSLLAMQRYTERMVSEARAQRAEIRKL
ncbi:(d)CMP kinase [Candidatus Saccharibacteria bacterium]|nr:(d)CMP kinase [Candidatus Saccharibacteria bacterium]MCB9821405.1 (d)CMP kinase [Candidatus Nomurabacteria bacterium]